MRHETRSMSPAKDVAIKWLFLAHNLKGLSHPFHFGGKFMEVGQKVKHHAPFDSVRSLTFYATEVIRTMLFEMRLTRETRLT
jgi:hypothetical protein